MTTFHWVRHAQSEGNLAAAEAKTFNRLRLDVGWETPDIPLTVEGLYQAKSLKCPAHNIVFTSPLRRATQTMHLALPNLEFFVRDYRLVDKEHGVFDQLSLRGMQELYPEEWAERQRVGKFYHRPTGGESWLDVVVRVKSFMDEYAGRFESVLVFSHDVTILCAIYVALGLSPDEILNYQKHNPVKNGSITTLNYEGVAAHGEDRRIRVAAS